ncbi:hypothetical protein L208DRAFT_278473 [Tricholoma matsutake]|nr:hypothetical protein L208DRAFT_278473 [Tricholoma matsutake 945]
MLLFCSLCLVSLSVCSSAMFIFTYIVTHPTNHRPHYQTSDLLIAALIMVSPFNIAYHTKR